MDYVNLKRVILHQQPEKQSGPAQHGLEQMAHNCLEVETGRPFYRSHGTRMQFSCENTGAFVFVYISL